MLQASEHIWGDQMDEVTVKGQLQQLSLAGKCPGLQGRDTVVLEVEVMEVAKTSHVLQADLCYRIVLKKNGLKGRQEGQRYLV